MIDSLKAQIEACERDMARLDAQARARGGMDWFIQTERDGLETCAEQLRADLRFHLGEPEPVRH